MSAPALEIRHSRRRTLTQTVWVVVFLAVGAAMAWFGFWLVTTGGTLITVIGIVLAMLGLLAAAVSLYMLWLNVQVLSGRAEPALTVDGEGLRWQGVTVPWREVIGLVAEAEGSISFAGGADVALDRGLERAMAAGGVNDGHRAIVVHVRDRAAIRASLGKADYLVLDGPHPGTGSLRVVLDAVTDLPAFARAVPVLAQDAQQRGIPFQVVDAR